MTALEEREAALHDLAELGDIDRLELGRIDWSKFWAREAEDTDWLIEPLIAKGRGHSLYAPAKTGKSLFLQDVAPAVATGRECLRRPAGEPLRVLYLDYENAEADIHDRLSDFGYGPGDDLAMLDYHHLPDLKPLDGPDGGEALVGYALLTRPDVVVIDTFQRAVIGPENDNDTIRAFYRYTGMPLKSEGIAWCRLDNTGKDPTKDARGASGKNDDVDVVWSLKARDAGRLELRAVHKRMSWVPETVTLERQTDPVLRHVCAPASWPPGTKEAAAMLDRLGIPITMGRVKAGTAVRDAGEHIGTEVLSAAVRYRKLSAGQVLPDDPQPERTDDESPPDRF